jgi:hypothetical protein
VDLVARPQTVEPPVGLAANVQGSSAMLTDEAKPRSEIGKLKSIFELRTPFCCQGHITVRLEFGRSRDNRYVRADAAVGDCGTDTAAFDSHLADCRGQQSNICPRVGGGKIEAVPIELRAQVKVAVDLLLGRRNAPDVKMIQSKCQVVAPRRSQIDLPAPVCITGTASESAMQGRNAVSEASLQRNESGLNCRCSRVAHI